MPARSGLLMMAEEAVNRLLALDPRALEELSAFSGRSLAVDVEGLDWRLCIGFTGAHVQFLEGCPQTPDAVVSGPPFSLLSTLMGEPNNLAVSRGTVRISGDAGFVIDLRGLLGRMDVDWEELLAGLLGDVAARPLAEALRGFGAWAAAAGRTLRMDLGELLREELQGVARPEEIDAFAAAVDGLRDDAARLEQRVARLRRVLDTGHRDGRG